MRIYIACGLTHVPRREFTSYVNFIHELASTLNSRQCQVRYALKDTDPQLAAKPFSERARLCYAWDRELVESAQVIIADATYPSIGIGIELQIAADRGTPIVLCFLKNDGTRAEPAEYANPDGSQHSLQIG